MQACPPELLSVPAVILEGHEEGKPEDAADVRDVYVSPADDLQRFAILLQLTYNIRSAVSFGTHATDGGTVIEHGAEYGSIQMGCVREGDGVVHVTTCQQQGKQLTWRTEWVEHCNFVCYGIEYV